MSSKRAFDVSALRSFRLAALCGVLFGAALLVLFKLQGSMAAAAVDNGYTGDVSKLKALDSRFGYTPEQVAQLLGAWGPVGRRIYVVYEWLDILVCYPSYGGVFTVIINRLATCVARAYSRPVVRHAWVIVLLALLADAAENAGQLMLVAAFNTAQLPASWRSMVWRASLANQVKWCLVGVYVGAVAVMLAAAVAARRSRVGRRRASSKLSADG